MGKPDTLAGLRTKVCNTVYSVTGKYFHPIFSTRLIFATEYISDTSDFYGAAVLLNDTIKTVIYSYAHYGRGSPRIRTVGFITRLVLSPQFNVICLKESTVFWPKTPRCFIQEVLWVLVLSESMKTEKVN